MYTLKYQDEFGIVHTSNYPSQDQCNFWEQVREEQGYKILIIKK